MKIETRQVVETKSIYIAEDGTEFNTEHECRVHDAKLIEKSLKLYNAKLEPSGLEDCIYVNLATEEEVEKMIALCAYHGVVHRGIEAPGVYMYMCIPQEWVDVSDKLAEIQGKEE
jgi:hypothetical protein